MSRKNTSTWGRQFCPSHPNVPLVEDYRAGDTVCPECGLVVGDRVIDVGSEWRTFADDTGDDPSRVGAAENPLLSGDLTTSILSTGNNYEMQRLSNRILSSGNDRALVQAFGEIRLMANRLNASQAIIDRANTLFKNMTDTKALRGRSTEANCAACLYIACNQEGATRTFKEICAVCTVSKKQIGKSFKLILRALNTSVEIIKTGDFMSRFCSNLELEHKAQNIATHVARQAVDLDIVAGKVPVTVAAAAIYFTCLAMDVDKSAKEIGDVAGVAETTIKQTFRAMFPSRDKLFPPDFVPKVNLDNISGAK
ncbi:transcription initiation factor IIB-like [Bolinopsis microptera]|uniref:transcription initiation factor IIB-like n=1 Tax=Bolinopsis microptera TaxID=2820187 RepID=UPI003079C94D